MIERAWLIGGALVGAALLYVAAKGAKDTGGNIGRAAVDMADGVLSGVVIATGEKLGIPATDESACDKAIREGRTWDASFACPALKFLKSLGGQSGGASGEW